MASNICAFVLPLALLLVGATAAPQLKERVAEESRLGANVVNLGYASYQGNVGVSSSFFLLSLFEIKFQATM